MTSSNLISTTFSSMTSGRVDNAAGVSSMRGGIPRGPAMGTQGAVSSSSSREQFESSLLRTGGQQMSEHFTLLNLPKLLPEDLVHLGWGISRSLGAQTRGSSSAFGGSGIQEANSKWLGTPWGIGAVGKGGGCGKGRPKSSGLIFLSASS